MSITIIQTNKAISGQKCNFYSDMIRHLKQDKFIFSVTLDEKNCDSLMWLLLHLMVCSYTDWGVDFLFPQILREEIDFGKPRL